MNKKHTTLITDFLKSKGNTITEATKTNYKNVFKSLLIDILDNNTRKYIFTIPTRILINKIDTNPHLNINNKISYLKMIKYLLEFLNKPYKQVLDKLKIYYAQAITDRPRQNKEVLKNSLFTFDKLMDLLEQSKDRDYLILYLLINFNTRNQDLIILYTENKKIISNVLQGKQAENILYFDEDDNLNYVRGNYKTLTSYGVKTNIINDPYFISLIKKKSNNTYLLNNRNNKPYTAGEMQKLIKSIGNKYIKNSNLNQQNIYKLIVEHFEKLNDNNKLKTTANNRGHQRGTQEAYYSTV